MNTQENNILIAEFMKYPKFEDGLWIYYKEGKAGLNDSELAFNSSWDWLMPVVEKISSFRNEDNQKLYTIETSFNGGVNLRVRFVDEETDPTAYYEDETTIKALYSAVIEFIKWYNKQ